MSCFIDMPFSNNPYITPWGTIDPEGTLPQPYIPCRNERTHERCDNDSYQYYVQPGDTPYFIADRMQVNLPAILAFNPGIDPNRLYIGQIIYIPAGLQGICSRS